nr:RING-box protein 2-like [Lytechinus pictus]
MSIPRPAANPEVGSGGSTGLGPSGTPVVPGTGTSANPKSTDQNQRLFSLKKWNIVAMWSWDVECDTCAICRVQVMDACLRCQTENKQEECVVVWGECNHSFHNCCMSLWVKQNNRCPLCQQEWMVQRIGK